MNAVNRMVGTVGLVATGVLVIGNVLHPFDGTTEMYGDAARFLDHITAVWVIDHLALSVALLAVPWVAWTWSQQLRGEAARSIGGAAWMLVLAGSAIGVIHLGGIDGVALPAYRDVLEASGGAAAETAGAAVLMKVHLTVFMAWLLTLWFGAQAFLGAAVLRDGRRRWLGWVLVAGSVLALASAVVTAVEGQLTTLSEPVLFRPSTVGLTLWLLFASLDLRAGRIDLPEEATEERRARQRTR